MGCFASVLCWTDAIESAWQERQQPTLGGRHAGFHGLIRWSRSGSTAPSRRARRSCARGGASQKSHQCLGRRWIALVSVLQETSTTMFRPAPSTRSVVPGGRWPATAQRNRRAASQSAADGADVAVAVVVAATRAVVLLTAVLASHAPLGCA